MQKSKLFTVVDKAGQNKTICWLGDDKFSEDIKTFDPDREEDLAVSYTHLTLPTTPNV